MNLVTNKRISSSLFVVNCAVMKKAVYKHKGAPMESLRNIFNKKFRQHYQPIVDMQTLDLIRYEALLRPLGFSNDTESLIRNMERAGEITELDLWAIRSAINNVAELDEKPTIAINVSASSICDPLFHEEVDWLLRHKSSDTKIGFEITESQPISDMRLAHRFVEMAKKSGCSVGQDDFGTGHARFRVAEQLELDYVKLSARLTTMIESSQQARSMIEKTAKLCDLFAMQVVAEHVDNPKQYGWLRDVGVEHGQGWLFAKASSSLDVNRNFRNELQQAITAASSPAQVRANVLAIGI